MVETSNAKKARLLGEPIGTATSRLRKMLLFEFAIRLGLDNCYRCKNKIQTIEEFSIEHTIPWQGAENPREAFFDINYILFSHLFCNVSAGGRNKSIISYEIRRKESHKKSGEKRKSDIPRYEAMLTQKRVKYHETKK